MLTRRQLLAGGSIMLSGVRAGSAASDAGLDSVVVGDLKVNNLTEPLGVESLVPRLSWRLRCARSGVRQIAYRIRVATHPDGCADLWDSGRVESNSTFDIGYRGQPLRSRQICYWRVEVETQEGKWASSPLGRWEMGLLEKSDWVAGWIAAEDATLSADRAAGLHWIWGNSALTGRARGFRFVFNLGRVPRRAVLMIVGRDELVGVWVNASELDFRRFRTSSVNNARMYVLPLDLAAGRNVLAVEVVHRPEAWPKTPDGALAAAIRIEGADGSTRRITTASGWSTGPTDDGWTSRRFSDPRWSPAEPARAAPPFEPWRPGPAMLLRRTFQLSRTPVRARLYVTALGAIEPRMNGQRVGDAVLAPESTDYVRRVLYRTYDVKELLRPGENVVAAIVGDGWYGSTGLFRGRYPYGPPPNRLLMQLEFTDLQGRTEYVTTDSGWQTSPSPIVESEIYDGETYDARLEQRGWDAPGFDARNWREAASVEAPGCAVVAAVGPPIRVTGSVPPVGFQCVRPRVYVFDFGQNFAGWCTLRARAPAGTVVRMRFAELLKPTGEIDQSNLRAAEACDSYIFRGSAEEECFRPRFTYHGFRYVELTGWPGEPEEVTLTGEVIHSDLPPSGTFHSSERILEHIWTNTLWGQRSNFMGIPTDCPQRDERLGWMGDAQVFWDAAAFNMDVAAFTRRFMGDVRDGQDPNGAFAEFNPQIADTGMRGAPGWSDAGVFLPWTVWWRYGDTSVIDENWDAMIRYAGNVARNNPQMLWLNERGSDFGDWLALDAQQPGDETTPKALIATAFWAEATAKLAQMAAATGRTGEADTLRQRHGAIVTAFQRAYVRSDGRVGNGSQTGYILALRFHLLPANVRSFAAAYLVEDIHRRGGVLSTGFLGTPFALDVLSDQGYGKVAGELLTRADYPSWGYMIRQGATTMWERWNGDVGDVAMNSFNHYALGAVVGFLYRRIAGIDAGEPGFRTLLVKPDITTGIRAAGAEYESVVGTIATDWLRSGNDFDLRVTVPCNTIARVYLPTSSNATILEAGRRLFRRAHLISRSSTVIEVGGGQYHFQVRE